MFVHVSSNFSPSIASAPCSMKQDESNGQSSQRMKEVENESTAVTGKHNRAKKKFWQQRSKKKMTFCEGPQQHKVIHERGVTPQKRTVPQKTMEDISVSSKRRNPTTYSNAIASCTVVPLPLPFESGIGFHLGKKVERGKTMPRAPPRKATDNKQRLGSQV